MSKESEKSILCGDGGLPITRDTVTWQTVLQIERDVRSKQGGWNHKSFWETRGLDQLTESKDGKVCGREFLEGWTQHSLADFASPPPRPSNFKLSLRKKAGDTGRRGQVPVEYPNPWGIRSEPSDPEHRLNWRLYMSLRAEKQLTYELPLCADAEGLLRADLVCFSPKSGLVEIVELKKGLKNGEAEGRDTPLMALVEAICYGLQLLRCWSALQPELNQHLNIEPFEPKHMHLILAAPYFGKDCNPAGSGSPDMSVEQAKKLRAIVSKVNAGVKLAKDLPSPEFTLSFGDVNESKWTLEKTSQEQERAVPPGSLLNPKSH